MIEGGATGTSKSEYNVVSNNHVSKAGYDGLNTYDANYNTFDSNTVQNNTYNGIFIEGRSIGNIVKGNQIYGCYPYAGIIISAGHGQPTPSYSPNRTIVTDNSIFNSGYGVVIEGSSNNIVSNNQIQDNIWGGIRVIAYSPYTSIHNIIESNMILGNGQGVNITTNANYLVNNIITENGNPQVEISGTSNYFEGNHVDFEDHARGYNAGTSPIIIVPYIQAGDITWVMATPTTSCTFSVSILNATAFSITHDGGSVGFYWEALVRYLPN
jgi:parallel beta-helix repeat protein